MKFNIIGRVHPERADISFSKITWQCETGGSISVICESSQLCVVLDDPRVDGYITAFVTAEHITQTIVSSLGFSLGSGYSVELIQVIEENSESYVFGVRVENLQFEDHNPVFSSTLNIARQDIFFRFALQDYTRALVESRYAFRASRTSCACKTTRARWLSLQTALFFVTEQLKQ